MKKASDSDVKVDYRGEHLGLRVGPDRCQAMVRDPRQENLVDVWISRHVSPRTEILDQHQRPNTALSV